MTWMDVDRLPDTGVQISVMVFGGLTLLIFGGGLFLAGRRHRRNPPPPPTSRVLTDLIFAQRAREGFGARPIGQPKEEEGGGSAPPDH